MLQDRRFEHGGNVYAHPGCVDFSANLNPLGIPAGVKDVLRQNVDAVARYPDPACTQLVEALATFEHVPPAWVLPCAGATDAFARIALVVRPQTVEVCAPCYAGYEQALWQTGARIERRTLRAENDFAFEGLAADADLAFVANPNNPTGRCVERDVLLHCLDRARERGAIVVLDECFIDLTQRKGSNDLLDEYHNLVLVKAFTKTFALAGLRLGYVLCANDCLLGRLREVGQPWAVSVPAQLAGVACVANKTYLDRSRRLIARERVRLADELVRMGLRVVPSETNYLLFRGPRGLFDACLERGVLIRSCDNYFGLDEQWYRVAVRTPSENDLLIETLTEVLK